jgi:ABC-type Fe3+/spermidine/putrescine transport system ATPase subunit
MHQGEILQIGSPKEVYSEPANLFVAQFIGEMNFMRAKVTGSQEVESALGRLACAVPASCTVGAEVTLAIRPEDLGFVHAGDNGSPTVGGKVIIENYLGDATLLEVEVRGLILRIKLPRTSDFHAGVEGRIVLPREGWRVYDGWTAGAGEPTAH